MLAFATTRLQKLQAAECCKCLSANGFVGFPDGQNAGKVSNLGSPKPYSHRFHGTAPLMAINTGTAEPYEFSWDEKVSELLIYE